MTGICHERGEASPIRAGKAHQISNYASYSTGLEIILGAPSQRPRFYYAMGCLLPWIIWFMKAGEFTVNST